MVATVERAARDAVDPAALTDAEIADELILRRAEIDRLEAEFAQLAWAGHRRGIGTADGSVSTPAWLRHHTGMREGDARTAITAGEVCELLPSIGLAWRDGRITATAARTITAARVDGHDLKLRALEPILLHLAESQDLRELRRACTHFRNCARADGTEPRDHDGVTISAGYDGRTILTGETFGRLDGAFTGTLHPRDVERMLCDCTVSRVVTGPDGLPLDVGRSRRTIPPQLDRARRVHDHGCRYPGCTRPHGWTQAHHVTHWKHGGSTALINLISLCDHHHHVVHQPGWTTTFDGHTVTVHRPDGTEVT